MEMSHRDAQLVAWSQLDRSALDNISHLNWAGIVDGRLESERLVEAVTVEAELAGGLVVEQTKDVYVGDLLALSDFASSLEVLKVGLDDLFLKLFKDLGFVVRVFHQRHEKVLRCCTASLRSSEEEGKALIDDPLLVVFEVGVN